jgi:hypothetical protein
MTRILADRRHWMRDRGQRHGRGFRHLHGEPAIGRRVRRAGLGDLTASQRRLFSMPRTDQIQHGPRRSSHTAGPVPVPVLAECLGLVMAVSHLAGRSRLPGPAAETLTTAILTASGCLSREGGLELGPQAGGEDIAAAADQQGHLVGDHAHIAGGAGQHRQAGTSLIAMTTSRPRSISTTVCLTSPPSMQRAPPWVRLASPEAMAASWSARGRSSR